MDTAALNALLCPICGLEFSDATPRALACTNGHSFDIARQGYLNLLTGHGTKFVPDTAAMVEARDVFLDAGHYDPLGDELARTVHDILHNRIVHNRPVGNQKPLIVDAGTGTGWYLHRILAAFDQDLNVGEPTDAGRPARPAAVGMDISKFALRRAARRNPEAANVVWDLWRDLPLGADTADVVLVVFAPRNPTEFARILKTGGSLVVVTPLPGHLAEIAHEAGMLGIAEDKESALVASRADGFELAGSRELVVPLRLAPSDVGNVALMGPAGHHLDPVQLGERLAALPECVEANAAFRISVFQPRDRPLVQHP